MDFVTGELRTIVISAASENREEQQKIQILSSTSQFGGEHEETITLYVPIAPSLDKLRKKMLRIPVTIYAKGNVVHRNFWSDCPNGIEVMNDKGEWVAIPKRPDFSKTSTKAS